MAGDLRACLLPDGRKIDFVIDRGADNLYVEVKTVHPNTADTDGAWQKYLARRGKHRPNVNFIVQKEWMGGAIYGNVFASRSHFLDYTREFETRLAAAKAIEQGPWYSRFLWKRIHLAQVPLGGLCRLLSTGRSS